jgi:GNAT superfamily N-acetyltransferase
MSRRMDSFQAHECRTKGLPMATRTARSVARVSSSSLSKSNRPVASPALPSATTPAAAPRLRLAAAKTGDHPLIHALLVSIFHGPSSSEFQAQLDEPGYEPSDRLIVKDADQIIAHLRLARQTIQLGSVTLPVARFMDLATATEYRSRGLATALLAAGERAAAERGVLVGLTRTRVPSLFAHQGWSLCGRHVCSTASPRAVLAELASDAANQSADEASPLMRPTVAPIFVRPLRRVELRAVVRLYDQLLQNHSGWPTRSEAYWEWLLARGACDRIFVAATESETSDFAKLLESIVGYVCVRNARIVELVTVPNRDDVARHLVERVCADCREQDGWAMRYDAPQVDPLHNLFRRAGGRLTATPEQFGEYFMAKLLDPLAALRHASPAIFERARSSDVSRPCELGIELRAGGGRKNGRSSGVVERFRIHFGRKSSRVETGGPSRHTIVLAYHDLAPLLLGDLGAEAMLSAGRMKVSTRRARELAITLLPGGLWWRPPLDDLLA